MRSVIIVTTQNSNVTAHSVADNITTFGELIEALPAVNFSGSTITVGKVLYSLTELDRDLPEGNLKIFISPKDMKAAYVTI